MESAAGMYALAILIYDQLTARRVQTMTSEETSMPRISRGTRAHRTHDQL